MDMYELSAILETDGSMMQHQKHEFVFQPALVLVATHLHRILQPHQLAIQTVSGGYMGIGLTSLE